MNMTFFYVFCKTFFCGATSVLAEIEFLICKQKRENVFDEHFLKYVKDGT